MTEYRQKPTQFVQPSQDELKMRHKRNRALAFTLAGFLLFIFFLVIIREPPI